MALIAKTFISRNALERMLQDASEKGIGISISVRDKVDKNGKNVYFTKAQNREEIEAKKDNILYSSGHVLWSKGECLENKPIHEEQAAMAKANAAGETPPQHENPTEVQKDDDLPF